MKTLLTAAILTVLTFATSNVFAENFKGDREISAEMQAERAAHKEYIKSKKEAIKLIENDEEKQAAKDALKAERQEYREAKKAEHIERMLANGATQEEIDAKLEKRAERKAKRRSKRKKKD